MAHLIPWSRLPEKKPEHPIFALLRAILGIV